MIDTTVSANNPGHGFANSKKAIAFRRQDLRRAFYESREFFDFSMKVISRRHALKMLVLVNPNNGDMGLPLDQENEFYESVVLREKNL